MDPRVWAMMRGGTPNVAVKMAMLAADEEFARMENPHPDIAIAIAAGWANINNPSCGNAHRASNAAQRIKAYSVGIWAAVHASNYIGRAASKTEQAIGLTLDLLPDLTFEGLYRRALAMPENLSLPIADGDLCQLPKEQENP